VDTVIDLEIEHVARTEIETANTVGDLRRALEDVRIPDAALIMDATTGCMDVPLDDYTPEDLVAGVTPTEHREIVVLSIEWDL
jgi:hypothetical protein